MRAAEVTLDWSSAEVHDRELTVDLLGEPPRGWKSHFRSTVRLLGSGGLGDIRLKRGLVHVEDVSPGTEGKLRHHLEAIVAQANEACTTDETREPGPAELDQEDADMTARFRGFGSQPAGAD